MNEVAERISKAMEQQNMSYGELSRITGIPKSAVFRYVTGQTGKMPIPRLELIAKALHVEPEYLMGWDNSASRSRVLTERQAEFIDLLENLSPAEQDRIIDQLEGIVQLLLSQRQG